MTSKKSAVVTVSSLMAGRWALSVEESDREVTAFDSETPDRRHDRT